PAAGHEPRGLPALPHGPPPAVFEERFRRGGEGIRGGGAPRSALRALLGVALGGEDPRNLLWSRPGRRDLRFGETAAREGEGGPGGICGSALRRRLDLIRREGLVLVREVAAPGPGARARLSAGPLLERHAEDDPRTRRAGRGLPPGPRGRPARAVPLR